MVFRWGIKGKHWPEQVKDNFGTHTNPPLDVVVRYLENPEYEVDSVKTDENVDLIPSVTPVLTRDVRAYKIRDINFAFS